MNNIREWEDAPDQALPDISQWQDVTEEYNNPSFSETLSRGQSNLSKVGLQPGESEKIASEIGQAGREFGESAYRHAPELAGMAAGTIATPSGPAGMAAAAGGAAYLTKAGQNLYERYAQPEQQRSASQYLTEPLIAGGEAGANQAIGSAIGRTGEYIAEKVPEVAKAGAKKLGKVADFILKKTGKVAGNIPEEVTEAYLAKRGELQAKPLKELSPEILKGINRIKDLVDKGSAESADIAGEIPGKFYRGPLIQEFNKVMDSFKIGGQFRTKEAENAYNYIADLKNRYMESKKGLPYSEIKEIIKGLDAITKYDSRVGTYDKRTDAALKTVRRFIDQKIKSKSPEFAEKMKEVYANRNLLEKVSDELGTAKQIKGKFTRLEPETQEMLTDMGRALKKEFVTPVEAEFTTPAVDQRILNQFKKIDTQGSRKTLMGKAIGAAIKGAIGGEAGYEVSGHNKTAAALGALGGFALDKYSGQVLKGLLDTRIGVAEGIQALSGQFGRFAAPIAKAAAQGQDALGTMLSILIRDPEFRSITSKSSAEAQ